MEYTELKSLTITNLKEKIEKRNQDVLNEFWNDIENKGTPLIESIEGDKENCLVTFIYKGDEKTKNVVLILPIIWANYMENRMERLLDTNLWFKTYKVRADVRFRYDISVNDLLDDDWNKRYDNVTYDKFNNNKLIFKGKDNEALVRSYVIMPYAEKHFWANERENINKGTITEYKFHSEKLNNDRSIWIYTPYNYKSTEKPYGFLLLTDGNEYIDVLSAENVLDNLISDKKIPPIVTIFVETNDNRAEELKCNDSFVDFLVEEVLIWARSTYNISNKAEEGIIGGFSLGGLTASYIGLKHSETFGNVISQSGSYWYKPEKYEGENWMCKQFENVDKLPLNFYLNIGVLETKKAIIDTNIKLGDTLRKKGYTVTFEEFKSAHDYLNWGETLANGLMALIGIDKN